MQRKRTSSQALAMYQAAALHGWRSGGGGGGSGGAAAATTANTTSDGGSDGGSSSPFSSAAIAATLAACSGTISMDEAVLLIKQQHSGATGGSSSSSSNNAGGGGGGGDNEFQLTRELFARLAAQGAHDSLAGLGVDAATYEYAPSRHYIRSFSSAIPIPFSVFDGIRHSKHVVKMTATQEENVMKAFDKMVKTYGSSGSEGGGNNSSNNASNSNNSTTQTRLAKQLSVSLPFVSAFFQQHCPELRSGALSNARGGATYLLLAVITGHRELAQRCLDAGAHVNDLAFLRDPAPPPGEMSHGYSPLFVAVLAEQVAMLDLLYAAGGDVYVYDRWGRTALHAAVALNSKDVVQWLLAKGVPRYVGDCFNITPAEGADDEYYAMLAMPNVSLHGTPKDRSRCVVLAPSSSSAHGGNKSDAAASSSSTATNAQGDIATTTTTTAVAAVVERSESALCHCHSGRPSGACGCVDDMFVRWTADRLAYTWCPGVDFAAIAQRQLAMDVKARPPAGLMRRRL